MKMIQYKESKNSVHITFKAYAMQIMCSTDRA